MSDTHDLHFRVDIASLPKGDIFIHAGDFMKISTEAELTRFRQFLGLLPYKHKIVIAGNHDFALDKVAYEKSLRQSKHAVFKANPVNSDDEIKKLKAVCTYLEHEAVEVEGLKIFGSPYSPEFYDWGFMYSEKEGEKLWSMIPEKTDILITHGPPYGILDTNIQNQHTGCPHLLERVLAIKPRLHVFGHIHQAYGT